MKALDLFPVTIYQTEIPNNDYLKDLMLSEIMEASEYLSPPDTWSTNKLKTSFESEPEEIKVVEKYKSQFPKTYNELIKLPGIGDYSASAISSFSNDELHPVVDGNVYRFISRLFGISTVINTTASLKEFKELKENLK